MKLLDTEGHKKSIGTTLVAAVLVFCFVVFSYLIVGGPIFETNDDIGFAMFCSGVAYVDKPDDHLMFIHYFLGRGLAFLYGLSPNIPWYGLLLLFAQVIAMTIVVRVLLAKGKKGVGIACGIVFLFAACLRPLVVMQFTSTGAIVASAGALLLLVAAEQGKALSLKYLLPALSIMALGAMIRSNSAKLVLIMLFLALVARFALKQDWKKFASGFFALLISCGLVVSLNWVNNSYYASGEWKDFYQLNRYLFLFMHKRIVPYGPETISRFESVNWTPADVQAFRRWYMLDEDTFSLEKIGKVVGPISPLHTTMTLQEIGDWLSKLVKDMTFLPMLVTIVLLLYFVAPRRMSRIAALIFLITIASMAVSLLSLYHLPNRLVVSILSFTIAVLLLSTSGSNFLRLLAPVLANRYLKTTSFVVVLSLMLAVYGYYRNLVGNVSNRNSLLRNSLANLNHKPEDLYINYSGSVPLENIKPFDNLKDYFGTMKLVCIGGYGRSPVVKARLKQWNIKDVMAELDNKHLYIILMSDTLKEIIELYTVQHYQKKPLFELVFSEPKLNFFVYKVSFEKVDPNKVRLDTDQFAQCPDFNANDLVLLPNTSEKWILNELKAEAKENDQTVFDFQGNRPCLVYPKLLNITKDTYSHFAIEVKLDKWITNNRKLKVFYEVNRNPKERSFEIDLLPDSKMHRYVFDLSNTSLNGKDKITSLSILPSGIREKPFGERIAIGKIGFLKNYNRDQNNQAGK